MRFAILAVMFGFFLTGCSKDQSDMKSYVIEVTSFKLKESVDPVAFWAEDAKVEDIYTSKQPGYISRESGYSASEKEVVVVVRWNTSAHAEASMAKFMTDESVKEFAQMIDGATMSMGRYTVE